MASRKLEDCDPKLAKAYLECVEEYKKLYPDYPEPFITCTWRSNEEQEELYMMSRNGKDDDGDGKIDEPDEWRTNARAGQSKHNLRPSKALDIAFRIPGKNPYSNPSLFRIFAMLMKKKGVEWGGDWPGKKIDMPHFQIQ